MSSWPRCVSRCRPWSWSPRNTATRSSTRTSMGSTRLTNAGICIFAPISSPSGSFRDRTRSLVVCAVKYDEDSARYRLGDPQLTIVGRLTRFKGHRHVIACMPALRKRFPRLKLVIVGSGPIEAELREQIAALGVQDSVVLEGYRPN